ncbi:MAG: nuclear transport factor 2 family protein [Rhodomicrobium sp.]
MASNIEATKNAYELFKRGDIPTLIKDYIDDNCTWVAPGPKDILPWAGEFKGKQEIANFFMQVAQNLDFTEFAPRDMIEQGDTVVVIGMSSARAKKTGKTVNSDWVHVFRFDQGKAVFFQEYTDTAAAVLAMP